MIKVGLAKNCTHFCGRPKSYKPFYGKDFSILGNPFYLAKESMRDEVCNKYEAYFNLKIKTDHKFIEAVNKIYEDSLSGDVILGCFCYPNRCHCDRILEEVVRIRYNNRNNK